MKQKHRARGVSLIILLALLFAGICILPAQAEDAARFPAGVIEVPQGTRIAIDDDAGTVTVADCPVEISVGDTFVVYLQDLPIGYVARHIDASGDALVIQAEKADKSVYSLLEGSGEILLTPDMYEFVPAPNVTARSVTVGGGGLSYSDGKLSMSVGMGGGTVEACLSNLRLQHSVSDGDVTVTLSGSWSIGSELSMYEDLLEDVNLGEMRIYGIGKIGLDLSLSQSISMSCSLSGTFSAGVIATQDGRGQAFKSFSVSDRTVSGSGSLSASLKVTAGIDVLIAEADIFVEVGVTTRFASASFYNEATEEYTNCANFRIYLFANAGAEAKYLSPLSGKTIPLASADMALINEDESPYSLDIHFENGKLVHGCSQGMKIPDEHFGGLAASFGSTLLSGSRDRILETSVSLPWDMVIDQDYILSNGTLNLNGHTLTVNGNLFQTGGTLIIGSGTLIVNGDYRLQTPAALSDTGVLFGASTGTLKMINSTDKVYINGDFVVQSSAASQLSSGTIFVKGDFRQENSGLSCFNSGMGLTLCMTADNPHVIHFDNPAQNSIGFLSILNNTTIESSIRVGRMELNGYHLIVNGTLSSTGKVDLLNDDPEPPIADLSDLTLSGDTTVDSITRVVNLNGYKLTVNGDLQCSDSYDLNGGELTVTGTLYHYSGTMFINGGKLNIGRNYFIVGSDSMFDTGKENYTACDGALRMIYDADEVHVGGDFMTHSYNDHSSLLTAGTFCLGGDLRQLVNSYNHYTSTNFAAQPGHTTVLNGSGEQVISFSSTSSGFGTLKAENEQLVFTSHVNWRVLGSNVHAASDNACLSARDMDFSGFTLTIDGDVRLNSNIDLNAGRMVVNGSVQQLGCRLRINLGRVDISGNYYLLGADSVFEPGKENFTVCDAELAMIYDADEVHVGGDFMTHSYNDHSSLLTAGTFCLGGDLRQLVNSYNHYTSTNFAAQPGHTTVLNGSGEQVISFSSTSSGFGTLKAENEQLVFTNNVNWRVLGSDVHAASDNACLSARDMDFSGFTLTIDGDVRLNSNIDLNAGRMVVNGSVQQLGCRLRVNLGRVDISGNYYLLGADSIFEPGKENYTVCGAELAMIYDADEVHVGGNFMTHSYNDHSQLLTAGTFCLGGDLRQLVNSSNHYTSFNFAAQPGHTTILNGSGKQVISFGSASSGFGTLELAQRPAQYEFSRMPCWKSLVLSAPVTSVYTLPDALTIIEENAFADNASLQAVYMTPASLLTEIGSNAFSGCTNLIEVRLPETVTVIAPDAFDNCPFVTLIVCNDYCKDYAVENNLSHKSVN